MTATIISGLVFFIIFANYAVAQPHKSSYLISVMDGLTNTVTIAPGAQNRGSSSVWTNETTISRPRKPRELRRPKVIRAPLLTLEYRILIQTDDGSAVETSPSTIFRTGDRLQLRIRTNQDGYLHIIQNSEGRDGELVYPDRRINNGKNFVRKNQVTIIPARCEQRFLDERGNCYFQLFGPAGREFYTVIFSREALPDVMSRITVIGGVVQRQDIERIKKSPNQNTSRPDRSPQEGGGAGGYAIWVTNNNSRNNEELIEKIVLNHRERERSNGR